MDRDPDVAAEELAVEQLERAGRIETDDPGELAIRDKANLVLGTVFLEGEDYAQAIPFLKPSKRFV